MSKSLREAIIDLLEADSTLMGFAENGVWYELAHKGSETEVPYVIVAKQPGPHEHSFQGEPLNYQMWVVKGVGYPDVAEAIDKRCRELLSDAELTVDGELVLYLRTDSDINYAESVDGNRYQHVGAKYRITTTKEEP